jgi:hypothetical protein
LTLALEDAMNTIKKTLAISAVTLAAAMSMPSFAQSMMDHSKMGVVQTPSMTDGEVRKVDLEAAKITIKPRVREDKVKVTIAEMSGKALAAKKAYFIHSNGGRPYAVIVNGRSVEIYEEGKGQDETYS